MAVDSVYLSMPYCGHSKLSKEPNISPRKEIASIGTKTANICQKAKNVFQICNLGNGAEDSVKFCQGGTWKRDIATVDEEQSPMELNILDMWMVQCGV